MLTSFFWLGPTLQALSLHRSRWCHHHRRFPEPPCLGRSLAPLLLGLKQSMSPLLLSVSATPIPFFVLFASPIPEAHIKSSIILHFLKVVNYNLKLAFNPSFSFLLLPKSLHVTCLKKLLKHSSNNNTAERKTTSSFLLQNPNLQDIYRVFIWCANIAKYLSHSSIY